MTSTDLNVEQAVAGRYSAASKKTEPALCCPVDYDAQWLKAIPAELIRRDYGCGDPAKYVQTGDHVLDLGSGGGKICYIASQVVGPEGQVTGVDINDDMLGLARQFQGEVVENIGWDNVSFRKGRIQDLKLDLDQLEKYLQTSPANDANSWIAAGQQAETLRHTSPMIANESVDVVVSNCVLNLVRNEDRVQLFNEIFRVLKPGGRAVISDIVSDGTVPQHLQDDATLWSGCISGAFEEHAFSAAFTDAGFVSVEILVRQNDPWQTVEGIEFRSMTIRAWKHHKTETPDAINLSDEGCCAPNGNCC